MAGGNELLGRWASRFGSLALLPVYSLLPVLPRSEEMMGTHSVPSSLHLTQLDLESPGRYSSRHECESIYRDVSLSREDAPKIGMKGECELGTNVHAT